jgi:hypothetical protein
VTNRRDVMGATSADAEHTHAVRALAAHFAGSCEPAAEARMRAHLPGCAACRRSYERELLLGRIDPAGLPAQERIARGLGLRTSPRRFWLRALAVPALAAAVLVLLLLPGAAGVRSVTAPVARGGMAAPSLWVYRVPPVGAPVLADGTMGVSDELAFAYANPSGKAHLLVFAIDEHRHVYWYHPAWPKGAPPPAALRALDGPQPHELPDAIRHGLDGRHLDLYAAFSDMSVSIEAVERAARTPAGLDELTAGGKVLLVRRAMQVSP